MFVLFKEGTGLPERIIYSSEFTRNPCALWALLAEPSIKPSESKMLAPHGRRGQVRGRQLRQKEVICTKMNQWRQMRSAEAQVELSLTDFTRKRAPHLDRHERGHKREMGVRRSLARRRSVACLWLALGICLLMAGRAQVRAWQGESGAAGASVSSALLEAGSFKHFVDEFNQNDNELYAGFLPNAVAWEFLKTNMPLFDSPDQEINEVYYFRWWTYRKHIERTPMGYVITEFLPRVGWAGPFNSIDCAAGHHFREGRWLAEPVYLDDYARFWLGKGGEPRRYSFWVADSLWARYEVTGDGHLIKELLPNLITNYLAWESDHRDENGLYWQSDDRDGMEVSIGGGGYRPTINSYMYGDAAAISKMARLAGQKAISEDFLAKARRIKALVQQRLWDTNAQFFKVLPRRANASLADAREELGYTPWYFGLPDSDKAEAWRQIMDTNGFYAPFGPTTAERRNAGFRVSYNGHECQWNGPSWPYATSVTLTAMANLLDDYEQKVVSQNDYFDLFKIYTRSQHRRLQDGRVVPWIDENLNPTNGDWIARTLLRQRGSVIAERGKDYNHSSYCDLLISGLVGLRPRADNRLEIRPLAPAAWDYFCLDQVSYHGHWLTIVWDQTGQRYRRGKGLRVWADGKLIGAAETLQRLSVALP